MNPPWLEKAEIAVLSVLMRRHEGHDDLPVDSGMFHRQSHKRLLEIILSENRDIDIVLFVEKLMNLGELDSLGGAAFVMEVYQSQVNAAHFKANVARLREYSARRMAIEAAQNMIEKASDDSEEFLETLGEPITEVLERATSTATERNKKTLIDTVMLEFKDLLSGKKNPHGLSVSLPTLSNAIRGFSAPRYAVLSAYPSGGKTLLAIQWLLDFAKQDAPSLFIGAEMPTEQIIKRAICTASGIDPEAFYDPINFAMKKGEEKPTKECLDSIRKACRTIINSPIHFEEAVAPQVNEVLTIIRRAVKRHKIKVVAIDYLQLIKDKTAKSQEQEISNISHALQAIAKELNLCLIVLSQQNKEGGTKYATTTTEDVDYHFSIEQVMDKEDEDFKKVTGLWINKDRHTNRSGFRIPIEKDEVGLFFKETVFQPS